MPKVRSTPTTKDDLIEHLGSSDDFQFEMEVFNLCTKGPFEAWHGGTYEDPVTKMDRQFDIRAQITKGICNLKLAIECKNLKPGFPLLLSRVPRRKEEGYHEVLVSFLRAGAADPVPRRRVEGPLGLFKEGDPVGKSTVQVGRSPSNDGALVTGDEEVYKKWTQAIASCNDLVASSEADYRLLPGGPYSTVLTTVIPVLVVPTGTLWVVDYAADGARLGEPIPCDECSLYLGKTVTTKVVTVRYSISHLLIFTKDKFDGYLNRLATNERYWKKIFPVQALPELLS